jgi:uncharacterized protein
VLRPAGDGRYFGAPTARPLGRSPSPKRRPGSAISTNRALPAASMAIPGGMASVPFDPFPPLSAWRHLEARDGYEVLSVRATRAGVVLDGHTTAIEGGAAFAVGYRIEVDDRWRTRRAELRAWWPDAAGHVVIGGDGDGAWSVNGVDRPDLAGCLDVDLESSACTNALPLRRAGTSVGTAWSSPAVYVRALDLAVERLEQNYERRPDQGDRIVVAYACERFGADFDLVYDSSGLVLDYPGLAVRAEG